MNRESEDNRRDAVRAEQISANGPGEAGGGSLAANISYNAVLKMLTYLVAAFGILYVSRALQPDTYGRVSFLATIAEYFTMAAGLGMPVYALRVCPRYKNDREKLTQVCSELYSIGILLAIISGAALVGMCFLLRTFAADRVILLIYGTAILWQAIGCEWLFRGLEQYRYLAVVSLLSNIPVLIAIVLAVRTPDDGVIYAALSVAATAAMSLCNFIVVRRKLRLRISLRINMAHMKPLIVFFAMTCMTRIYGTLDITMLGFLKSKNETGLYTLVSRAKILLACFGSILIPAVLPRLSQLWGGGKRKEYRELVHRMIGLVMLVNLSMLIFVFIFAEDCVLLAGGKDYAKAVTALRITVLSIAPIGLSNVLGGLALVAAGRERILLRAECVGAIVNLALNIVVIPLYSIEGAAATTLIAELIVWVMCHYSGAKETGLSIRDMLPDVRLPIACAAAAVPAWLVRGLEMKLIFRLAIAGATYFGICAILLLILREPSMRSIVDKLLGKKAQESGESSGSGG